MLFIYFLFLYRPWNKEPNNSGGSDYCAVIYYGGRYNDVDCSRKAAYICEKDAFGNSLGMYFYLKPAVYLLFAIMLTDYGDFFQTGSKQDINMRMILSIVLLTSFQLRWHQWMRLICIGSPFIACMAKIVNSTFDLTCLVNYERNIWTIFIT